MKYTFHLLGLGHLPQSRHYMSCAYTQKNIKLSKMLLNLGHEVIFYGAEGSDVECSKFVQTHTLKDICEDYGDGDNRFEIGYDWTNNDFRADFSSPKPSTEKFRAKCIEEIKANKNHNDFLLCTQGLYHKPIADAVQLFLTCEPGIGYTGSVKGWYRSFESSSWQSFAYGSEGPFQSVDGSYYDRVIPNYFEPDDIEFNDKKKDYYLYIGRMIKRKGIITAALACNAINQKLIIAGQGAKIHDDGFLRSNGNDLHLAPGTWEYIGYADVKKRKKLFSDAIATFVPTEYLEPFAGTHIESMLSGTPVITTSFGVFNETIPECMDGVIGFKCNTLDDFTHAAIKTKALDPHVIRKYAEQYLVDKVKYKFQKWFDDLYEVYMSAFFDGKGWMRINL